jgi:AIPR protein
MQGETVEGFEVSLERAVEDQLPYYPGWLKRDVFVRIVGDYLIEDGTLEDLEVCYYVASARPSMMEVAGYAISDDGHMLDLAVAKFGCSGRALPPDQVRRQFRWALNFAMRCRDGLHLAMEESSPAYDMAQGIHAQWSEFSKVRIFLFTDGRSNIGSLPEEKVDGLPVIQNLWDIERLRRLVTSGRKEEVITVDLEELGGPLRCLSAIGSETDYSCVFAVIPGQLLADMYDQYGAKLLQRNVRSFLQLKGKVNKGIIETIRSEPSRFLAYNNGISATATDVTLDERPDGTYLVKLDDLQIVNGGQTTATLHHAATRDHADLSQVRVPAKITVVRPDQLDQLVPKISRFANSQNTIAEADFESNSPFHVELERLSRTIWAPAPAGATRQSHWYYERVRGQYQVDRARQTTSARQRSFDDQNPRSQRFTKTDAAKYDMTFRQLPYVVSLGAQKCFQSWTLDVLADRTFPPNDFYFQGLIAKAILFEQTRKIIQRLNPGAGYLANVTTYTVARLVQEIDQDALLAEVWRQQTIPAGIADAVRQLSPRIRQVLLRAPGSGNVTEWSKKEDCWKRVLDISWSTS